MPPGIISHGNPRYDLAARARFGRDLGAGRIPARCHSQIYNQVLYGVLMVLNLGCPCMCCNLGPFYPVRGRIRIIARGTAGRQTDKRDPKPPSPQQQLRLCSQNLSLTLRTPLDLLELQNSLFLLLHSYSPSSIGLLPAFRVCRYRPRGSLCTPSWMNLRPTTSRPADLPNGILLASPTLSTSPYPGLPLYPPSGSAATATHLLVDHRSRQLLGVEE